MLQPANHSIPPRIVYLAHNVHRNGGQERAAYEVIDRLKLKRAMAVIAIRNEVAHVQHIRIRSITRPVLAQALFYKVCARNALRKLNNSLPRPAISVGIGASGGPVDMVVAQYCQEAYRQRVGAVRADSAVGRWWHRRNMAHFCAEERAVYQNRQLMRVIAVSRGVGRELVEFYGINPAIIRHIPNGVDLSVFYPLADASARKRLRADLGLPTDGFLACFVGGDWRRKGLRPAIESLRTLKDVHLVVVGAGDQAEFAAYASIVGAEKRVHFAGKRSDPQRFLQASDAYVFPSLYEAFSLSCIEAAACGLPLVVTKINGTEELVAEGMNGFFTEHHANPIAKRLEQLRDDPALRDRMSARAAADASRFGWDEIAEKHEAVFAELG
jgi:UDP-glucose:(heptosyl)LPS alpha-1,3-glucosyltransferase